MVQTVRTVDVACTGCGGRDDRVLYTGREHEYHDTTDQPFDVVRCQVCGLTRLNPRPDVSELGVIYPPDYYAYHLAGDAGVGVSGLAAAAEKVKARRYQRRCERLVARLQPPDGPIRVLDIGCADGRLLTWYRQSKVGARLETHGIDLDAAAVEVARTRGHRAVAGRFEVDTELKAGSYQLILASHVIEHVDDPRAFAKRAAELLAPGGIFVVATPNVDSIDARRLGRYWGGNHFPRHWTFYDPDTITRLAESVGLVVDHVGYEVNPVFWNWTAHCLASTRFSSAAWPDRVFPPVGIFHPSLHSSLLLGAFTALDAAQKALTGRTASMVVEMRKHSAPGPSRLRGSTPAPGNRAAGGHARSRGAWSGG